MSRFEMTPRQLMDLAWTAYCNARHLHRDAEILFDRRRYSRAASLAIIGCEEAGKAQILALAGMGKFKPEKLPNVLKALRYGAKSHALKQGLSMIARLIADVMIDARATFTRLTKSIDMQKAPETFPAFLQYAVSAIGPELVAMIELKAGNWRKVQAETQEIIDGSWQRIRDAGLYADFDGDRVQEPSRISKRKAAHFIEMLARILRGLRPLMPVTRMSDQALVVASRAVPTFEQMETINRLWSKGIKAHKSHLRAQNRRARARAPHRTRQRPNPR